MSNNYSSSVEFQCHKTNDELISIYAPSEMPEPNEINKIEEPMLSAQIITKSEYIGGIIKLCIDRRGTLTNQVYLSKNRVELSFNLPLSEIVFDFYDKLKSISRGYASLDYELIGFQVSKMSKLDIMLNGEKVDALSAIVHKIKHILGKNYVKS